MKKPGVILTLLAALVAAPLPAAAQTDDRILNDVFTVLSGETLLARTRQLCTEFTDVDIEPQFTEWTDRNLEVLRVADVLVRTRERLEPGMLAEMRNAAAREAEMSFSREADKPGYCQSIGDTMDARYFDLDGWFAAETQRMAEAEQGLWPELDLDDAQPVADAMALKQIGFMMWDVFARCANLFEPAAQFEEASTEWQARNGYSIELADRVLKNWGALHPSRWETARDESGTEVDALFADLSQAEAHCRATASRTMAGEEDIDQVNPALYESVLSNAEIVPGKP